MKRFRVSPQATTDLREICDYIASDNRDAADRLIGQFFDHFQRLAEHPEPGERRDDLYPGVRPWSTGRYIILYQPTSGGVDIPQVAHGAREIESLLARRRP